MALKTFVYILEIKEPFGAIWTYRAADRNYYGWPKTKYGQPCKFMVGVFPDGHPSHFTAGRPFWTVGHSREVVSVGRWHFFQPCKKAIFYSILKQFLHIYVLCHLRLGDYPFELIPTYLLRHYK